MGKFLVFFAVGFGAAMAVESIRKGVGGMGRLPHLPRKGGFIPLETPRSTLVNASASSRSAFKTAYLSRDQHGLGQIDYFLM
jgi:hypothetical protein